jgi:hypothetical protein
MFHLEGRWFPRYWRSPVNPTKRMNLATTESSILWLMAWGLPKQLLQFRAVKRKSFQGKEITRERDRKNCQANETSSFRTVRKKCQERKGPREKKMSRN